jgi:hypothetical protein
MEAYSQVHQPQIITEESIQQVADMWVEACIEIGVNFSDYTLDELTEAFILDISSEELSESVLNEILGMPGAQNFGAGLRQQFGRARRAVGSAVSKVAGGVKDVAGAGLQGYAGQRTTSKNPIARAANAVTRTVTAPQRAAASVATGLLTGKPATPAAKPSDAKPQRQGPPVPPRLQQKPKPPGSGGSPIRPVPGNERAPAKPASTAPAKPASTSAQKPSGTKPPTTPAAGTKAAGPESIKPKTPNPLLAGGDIRRMQQSSQMRQKGINVTSDQLKVAERTKPTEVKKESIDVFDLVKGYLLDEGYAETEEGAMVMMVNMSEGWRESILEVLGGQSGDGYIGHPRLGIKNPMSPPKTGAKKPTTSSNTGLAGRLGNRAAEIDKLMNQSYEAEGEQLDELSHDTYRAAAKERNKRVGEDQLAGKHDDAMSGQDKLDRTKRLRAKAKKTRVDEELELWVEELIAEGYDLSDYTWEEVAEIYFQELELVEAQSARENPESHDKDEKKKYEKVRGEKTPMPPRGDKRREDFEKWYRANVR